MPINGHLGWSHVFAMVNSAAMNIWALISNVLGEGMSSRLFQKIREERGLAYSVYTYLTRFENCGLLSVYVGTTKEDYKDVIKLIKEEFKNIKENLVFYLFH